MKFTDEVKYRDFEFGETLENAEKVGEEIAEVAENESLRKKRATASNGGKKEINALIKDIEKLVKETPWAMFSSEIRRLFGVEAGTREDRILWKILGELEVKKISVRKIAENFGYHNTRTLFAFLEKSSENPNGLNPNKISREPLLFLREEQVKRRLVLEFHGIQKGLQPAWFRLIVLLCRENWSHTIQELPDGIYKDKRGTSNIRKYPLFFHENVDFEEGTRGTLSVSLTIKEEFYNNVYEPLKKWLTPEGYKVFKEWKEKYHWGRKID